MKNSLKPEGQSPVTWVDRAQLGLVLVMAPFFLFPDISWAWIFLFLPAFWVLRWKKSGKFFDRTILDLGIFILCFQLFISCLMVPDIVFSLPKIAGLVYGIFLFYSLVGLLKTKELIKKAIVIFMVGSVIFVVVGFLGMQSTEGLRSKQIDSLVNLREMLPYVEFTLPNIEERFNPNEVGGILVLMLPMFIAFLIWFRKNKLIIFILTAGLILELFVLLLTLSRGSWIAILASSLFLLYPFVENKKRFSIISSCSLVFFIIFYIILIGPEDIQPSGKEIGGKVMGRQQAWSVGIKTIGEHPLTGAGINRTRLEPGIGFKRAHVHNHLIHTAAELGIPALMAYLAILIGAGYMCSAVWKKAKRDWMQMAILGLGCGQLAHLIFGIGDSVALGARPGIVFWVSLALISSIYNIYKKAVNGN